METSKATDHKEIYYVISLETDRIVEGDTAPSIMIDGTLYKKDTIFVGKRLDENSSLIYTYLPNNKVWIPNTGINDSFWQISLGYTAIARERITRELAYELADEMRDYATPIASILMGFSAGKTLPY